MSTIIELIDHEEGYRSEVYYCAEGYPTIGYGKKIGFYRQSLSDFSMISLPKCAAKAWLQYDLDTLIKQVSSRFPWFKNLNQPRQDVVISMCYQLGFNGFCEFEKTIKFINLADFESASVEMLDSRWATQTKGRAERHSKVMLSGDYSSVKQYENFGE